MGWTAIAPAEIRCVTVKKNFRPVIAWFSDAADVPWSTR
jgi:hypothetical protein